MEKDQYIGKTPALKLKGFGLPAVSRRKIMNDDIRIIKGIAPKTTLVNGKRSPCECTQQVTCPYCVQASLLGYGKQRKAQDDKVKAFIAKVKRKGLRRSSILLGVEKSTLSRWIKKANVPREVVEKFAA